MQRYFTTEAAKCRATSCEDFLADRNVFMKRALELASLAEEAGEVPVGALVVLDGRIIFEASNARETSRIATHHAEILAIEGACRTLGRWRLSDCDLYVTLEPCTMCAGAIVLARFREVVFGAMDPKAGAVGSLSNVLADERLNHRPRVVSGILAAESSAMLSSFFKARRK
jgi:tRNA(adenine34) deaminase